MKEYFFGDHIALLVWGIEAVLLWRAKCVIYIRHWRSTSLEIVLRYWYEALMVYFSGDRIALFI